MVVVVLRYDSSTVDRLEAFTCRVDGTTPDCSFPVTIYDQPGRQTGRTVQVTHMDMHENSAVRRRWLQQAQAQVSSYCSTPHHRELTPFDTSHVLMRRFALPSEWFLIQFSVSNVIETLWNRDCTLGCWAVQLVPQSRRYSYHYE